MAITLSVYPSPPGPVALEIVERKGMGHPDTICDALAEQLSRRLCQVYDDLFGVILHFNVDKGLLFAGRSRPAFNGGEILEPMEIYLAGRATLSYDGFDIPVEDLAVEGARAWFRRHVPELDPERHVRIHPLIRPGSPDLVELYLRQAKTGVAMANDTSCGVGYAPLSALERTVLALEAHLRSGEIRRLHPAFGPDIKIMGLRRGDGLKLTLACAFVGKHVQNLDAYLDEKRALAELARKKAEELSGMPVTVEVNAADAPENESVYLTVTGTSGESGDDGQVGRGNRANGLITPYRPMNLEAVAGKNPVTHVGKIYNIVAQRIAERIVHEIDEVHEAQCFMVSQIGRPIHDPQSLELKITGPRAKQLAGLEPICERIVDRELAGMGNLWRLLNQENIAVY